MKWSAPILLAIALSGAVILSLHHPAGHAAVTPSVGQPTPHTQPANAAWEYRTISMYDLVVDLAPAPNFDGGLRWHWEFNPDSESSETKRAREARELAQDKVEQRQRESNQAFEQRLSKKVNEMSAQGFEPCAPPAGFLPPELNNRLSLIWFRKVR
jgi:hypothetical protein